MRHPLIIQITDDNGVIVLNANDYPDGVLIVPPGVDAAALLAYPWTATSEVPPPPDPEQCGSTETHAPHTCAGLAPEDLAPAARFCGHGRPGLRFAACDLPPAHAGPHHSWFDDGRGSVTVSWDN